MWGGGRLEHTTSIVIFSRCLGEALRGSLHHHRHHAVVLTKLSLDTLLDQEFEGRHRAERVQNSEVPYVRCLIGWIEKTFDYINRVKLTLPLSVYEGYVDTLSPLVAMLPLDRSCVIVGNFFEILRSPTVASEPGLCVDVICTSRT